MSSPTSSGGAPNKRLESWKEIAAHLGRDVTTVRRWEKKEGLPVHRHVHDKLGSVYAYSAELEEWQARRSVPATGSQAAATSIRAGRWRAVALVVAALSVCIIFVAVIFSRSRGDSTPRTALNPEIEFAEIVTLTEQGDLDQAYQRAVSARGAAPGSAAAAAGVAYVLTYAGFLDQAVRSVEQVLAADPDYIRQNGWWAPTAFLYQRRFDRFLQSIGGTDTSSRRLYRTLAKLEQGEPVKPLPPLIAVDARTPPLFNQLVSALDMGVADRKEEALAAMQSIANQRRSAGDRDGEVTFKQAQILSLAGDAPAALAMLEEAVAQGFVCATCFETSVLLEPVRALRGYQDVRQRALERQREFGRRFGL
jgi:tetratricopeptide (TPR) repeat protein